MKFAITFATAFILALFLSACSVLPYENDYSCRLKDNYGKCMSIQESYQGAKDNAANLELVPGKRVELQQHARTKNGDVANQISSEHMYIEALYREMAALIREPETPITRAPKELRTLILSYTGDKDSKTLYMPRYIYSIVEDANFVIQHYFNTPERDTRILQPKRAN